MLSRSRCVRLSRRAVESLLPQLRTPINRRALSTKGRMSTSGKGEKV